MPPIPRRRCTSFLNWKPRLVRGMVVFLLLLAAVATVADVAAIAVHVGRVWVIDMNQAQNHPPQALSRGLHQSPVWTPTRARDGHGSRGQNGCSNQRTDASRSWWEKMDGRSTLPMFINCTVIYSLLCLLQLIHPEYSLIFLVLWPHYDYVQGS